jgi:hypothetical protein
MPQPHEILDRQGLIEAEIVLEARDIGLRDVRILEVRTQTAARSIMQDDEKDERDQNQQRNRLKRPPYDVVKQGSLPPK